MKVLMTLIEAVMLLTGAGSPEELAESELERFESLASLWPLRSGCVPAACSASTRWLA